MEGVERPGIRVWRAFVEDEGGMGWDGMGYLGCCSSFVYYWWTSLARVRSVGLHGKNRDNKTNRWRRQFEGTHYRFHTHTSTALL